jgi:hypothetical protein
MKKRLVLIAILAILLVGIFSTTALAWSDYDPYFGRCYNSFFADDGVYKPSDRTLDTGGELNFQMDYSGGSTTYYTSRLYVGSSKAMNYLTMAEGTDQYPYYNFDDIWDPYYRSGTARTFRLKVANMSSGYELYVRGQYEINDW